VVLREEDVSGPDVTIDDLERTSLGSQDINSTWVKQIFILRTLYLIDSLSE
jgi:hypothetical protein